MRILSRLDRHGDVERLHGTTAPAGRPLYWTSCYRLPGEGGRDVLVDSLAPRLARLVAEDARPAPAVVLLTHHHEDHSGGAAVLADAGARVLAPAGALGMLGSEWERLPLYRNLVWGRPAPVDARPLAPRVDTPAGRFRVLASPGHSTDHCCFLHEERGWLFTGDAYFGRLRYARAVENVPLWIETLREMSALDPERAYPAHGPVVDRPREAFDAAADWLEALARRARALRGRGRSVRDIRRDLLGPEGAQFWISAGDFSGMNLIRSLLTMDEAASG